MVPPARLERAAHGLGIRCSVHLSYGGNKILKQAGDLTYREHFPVPMISKTRYGIPKSLSLHIPGKRTCCQWQKCWTFKKNWETMNKYEFCGGDEPLCGFW